VTGVNFTVSFVRGNIIRLIGGPLGLFEIWALAENIYSLLTIVNYLNLEDNMGNIKLLLSLVFVLTFGVVSAYVGTYDCGMSGMMFGNYGFGGMFFGWLIGLLFVAVLVLLIAWLVKQIQKK